MLISQTAQYALQALVHIADNAEEGRIQVEPMAAALQIPRNYLSKILHGLGQAGLLDSQRGPRGGFRLARDSRHIRLLDVVREFSPIEEPGTCLLGGRACDPDRPCVAHERWAAVRSKYLRFLEDTSLHDLASSRRTPARADGGNQPPAER